MKLVLLVLIPFISIAYADIESNQFFGIDVQDRIYEPGEIITLDGYISTKIQDHPILVSITNPLNSTISIDQIPIKPNNNQFNIQFQTGGEFYKYDGIYKINISYYTERYSTDIIIRDFNRERPMNDPPRVFDSTRGCINLEYTETCIAHVITGNNKLNDIIVNIHDKSIILDITSNDPGFITLVIPPTVQDGIFTVLVDDIESNNIIHDVYEIVIPFPANTQQIEIIGTYVVPEFEFISIVMILSMIVIIYSTKHKPLITQ